MTMTPHAAKKSKGLSIIDFLRPHWKALTLALLAVAGETATDLLEPWPLKIVLDYLLQSKQPPGWMSVMVGWIGQNKLAVLNFAVVAVAVIAIVGALSSLLEKYLTTSVGQWVMHDLRRTLYHHIHRLSLAEHDEKRTGDLIGRVTSDIEAIQAFVTTALLGILANVLTLLGIIGVMLYLNWRFTLISLSIAPVLFLVVYFFTRRIKKASRDVRKKESELVSIVEEVFSSIRVVKAFAREDYEERRFERQSLENVEMALVARSIKMKLSPIVEIIVATGTCLMLGYGARLVLAGQLTVGALVVFLLYLGKMYKPMRDLSKMTDTVSKAAVGFERIREVLETESGMRDQPGARPAARFKGKIEFDKVSFGYNQDQLILKDVSFEIEPGQVAAFVGPTGGGKIDHHQPGCALLRSRLRGSQNRRDKHTQLHDEIASPADQFCFAGDASVPRTHMAKHRLWPPGSQPRGDYPRRKTGQRRRIHRGDARGLRHDGRRTRRDAFRGPAPAYRHRAGRYPQYSHPGSGRAHIRTGRRVRAGRVRSPRPFDGRQDLHRHRAPPGDDPARQNYLRGERQYYR